MNRIIVTTIVWLAFFATSGAFANDDESSTAEENHAHAEKSLQDAHKHSGGSGADMSKSCVTVGEQDCDTLGVIADQLFEALSSGDTQTVKTLFAPDILIFESGNAETSLEQYAGHHMPADMAFLAKMDKTLLSRQVIAGTDLVVVNSRSLLSGVYKDEDLNIASTETLVLRQEDGAWQVVHVHWSSSP